MTNQIYLTLFGEQDLSDIFEIQKDLRSAEMRQAMGVPSTLSDVEEWLEIVYKNTGGFALFVDSIHLYHKQFVIGALWFSAFFVIG